MDGKFQWRDMLPAPIREMPADLAAIALLTVCTAFAATVPGVRETPLRIVLGLPFVLFVPGYALVTALFPEAGTGPSGTEDDATGEEGDDSGRLDDRGIDGIERVALSFGLSIAVVPLLGLILNFTPWGIRLVPILVAVGGFTLLATAVATQRRRALLPEERFRVPYQSWLAGARAELFAPESRTDAALNVMLIASIILAVGSIGFAVAVPNQGESFTEFYLLTETDDGELVADDYPTEFVRGEPQPVVVGIGNQEHERTNYTVVIEIQDVEFSGPNETQTTVVDSESLGRFSTTLAHNRTHQQTVQFQPTMTGQRLRIAFLLFLDDGPADPSIDNAYRETHLWVNVSATA